MTMFKGNAEKLKALEEARRLHNSHCGIQGDMILRDLITSIKDEPEPLAVLALEASWHYDAYDDARIVGGVVLRGMADAPRHIPVTVKVWERQGGIIRSQSNA